MVKLATFFTGYGPMEYAMKRLDVKHESVIACDNSECPTVARIQEHKKNVRNMKSVDVKVRRISRIRNMPRRMKDNNGVRTTVTEHYMRKVYEANFPNNTKYYMDDIMFIDGRDFRNKIDFIYGSVPDRVYTIDKRLGGVDDIPRDTLLFEYIRMIREMNPSVFMVQFTKDMTRHTLFKYMTRIKDAFKDMGYHIKQGKLNALDCNIPQSRKRIFIVGFLDKEKCEQFEFPTPRKLEYTMRDFLLYNTPEGNFKCNKDGGFDIEHKAQTKEELDEDPIFKKLYLSEKMQKYVLHCSHPRINEWIKTNNITALTITKSMAKMQRANIDNYVSIDGVSTEVGELRRLHTREVLRLMGYDDDYDVSMLTRKRMLSTIGQSTVVDVLMELVKEIGKVMEWEKNDGTKF